MLYLILIALLFLGGILFFAWRYKDEPETTWRAGKYFLIILGAAFLLRVIFGYLTPGFFCDMNIFKAWGKLCNDVGYNTAYVQKEVYLDYPPGYLYVLSWLDGLRGFLNIPADSQ
ncbi:MAG: hypothetical protein RSC76_06635, partial [Oscillospiraceae bacterium]